MASRPPIPLAAPAEAIRRFDADVVEVPDALIERLQGVCEVVVESDDLVESGRDWWPISLSWAMDGAVPAVPAALARPSQAEEVAAVLAVCNEARVPVTPAAGRSGVCGGVVPVFGGVIVDLCRLAGVVDVDSTSLVIDVLPGTLGNVVEEVLESEHALTLGHWPQSMALSTVGGWLACRSAGQYSTRYGKIEDMVVGLDVVLADGRRITTGGAPRAAVGPDLTQVFVGSEGTLGIITGARLRAHRRPPAKHTSAWGFSSFTEGLGACRRILQRGATPAVLRLYDQAESHGHFSLDRPVLLVLDEADETLIAGVGEVVSQECQRSGAESLGADLVEHWLEHRNDVSALETVTRQGVVADTVEVSGRWRVLAPMYEAVIAAVRDVAGTLFVSAHQSHAYTDGACLYFTFAGQPPQTDHPGGAAAGVADKENYYRAAWDAAMGAVLAHRGALSHHHGVGINRGRYMTKALGPAFDLLTTLKAGLDPKSILNPGKLGLPSQFGALPWQ